MPLNMNRNVFITCAVTGSGDTTGKSDKVPVTPEQIAASAIDAAKAGAAVVHCHVRNPETGAPSRDVELFREVTERIRDAEIDVVLNLTAGMGGDLVLGGAGRDQVHGAVPVGFGKVGLRLLGPRHADGAPALAIALRSHRKALRSVGRESGFIVQWAGGFSTALVRARIGRTMCAVAPDGGDGSALRRGGAHPPLGKVEG